MYRGVVHGHPALTVSPRPMAAELKSYGTVVTRSSSFHSPLEGESKPPLSGFGEGLRVVGSDCVLKDCGTSPTPHQIRCADLTLPREESGRKSGRKLFRMGKYCSIACAPHVWIPAYAGMTSRNDGDKRILHGGSLQQREWQTVKVANRDDKLSAASPHSDAPHDTPSAAASHRHGCSAAWC